MTTRNPSCEGTDAPPMLSVIAASTAPATALDTDVPIERISVFRLFAAAVSVSGTAAMTSAGIAPYARPIPAPMMLDASTRCQICDISTMFRAYPAATTTAPHIKVTFGPSARDRRRYGCHRHHDQTGWRHHQIGRASCRE